ncbi:UDP-N-acetylmuramoyl-L-alanyl-D-glutamate--2,6-diaminopimelate ligase [Alkalibacterium sp. f15]|uniref:UDP-N-acetylmuramoyl-L-alanyl-D-glutamate--2, 6-diaminopimelate ligase n=1 Tax=Alkalibacterium sp. f15 TaxID=3414029 RepID=UPI003BF8F776
MKWNKLIENIQGLSGDTIPETTEIKGVTDQSTEVEEGFVFVAVKGFKNDGHRYISQAIEKGASVIIGQQDIELKDTPYIKHENTRKLLGQLAASYHNNPTKTKLVIGVTGTNGKTTTGLFLTHLLRKKGYTVSFFGTVFNEMNGERTKSSLTTPSASTIQKALAESNDEAVVIEVSSQGLEQHRMEGMSFDYALFTNLQHDHLDYHNTIEEYFFAKKKLFALLKDSGKAIVNEDDKWGEKLSQLLTEEGLTVLTVGEKHQYTRYHLEGSTQGSCTIGDKAYAVELPLPGKYNLSNLSMAMTVLQDLNEDITNISQVMKDLEPIPGRFEVETLSENVKGVIDYAHTAEALQGLLPTIKEIYPNHRLVHIFGFRGNRDSTKREKMMQISAQFSDETILTLDDLNGLSEDAMEAKYLEFVKDQPSGQVKIILDRTIAISDATKNATEPTLVVVTGKGHESYQQDFELSLKSDKETFLFLKK